MHIPLLLPLLLAPLQILAAAAELPPTTDLTLRIPPTQAVPNPRTLPPSTHATLTALHSDARALLTPANTFVFRNVSAGSYLLDVHCATHAFAPLRVDVVATGAEEEAGEGLKVAAWETFRGNDWDNKGEALGGGKMRVFDARVLGPKAFYVDRKTFDVLSILKNPMILMGIVSMAIFIGMPKLVENMDPEMRKEWEESQKSGPMSALMGGGGQSPQANFDMAAFLSGSSSSASKDSNGGSAAGGEKKGKGGRK